MKSLNRPMFNMGGRVNRVGMAAGGNTITSMLANGVQNAVGNGQQGLMGMPTGGAGSNGPIGPNNRPYNPPVSIGMGGIKIPKQSERSISQPYTGGMGSGSQAMNQGGIVQGYNNGGQIMHNGPRGIISGFNNGGSVRQGYSELEEDGVQKRYREQTLAAEKRMSDRIAAMRRELDTPEETKGPNMRLVELAGNIMSAPNEGSLLGTIGSPIAKYAAGVYTDKDAKREAARTRKSGIDEIELGMDASKYEMAADAEAAYSLQKIDLDEFERIRRDVGEISKQILSLNSNDPDYASALAKLNNDLAATVGKQISPIVAAFSDDERKAYMKDAKKAIAAKYGVDVQELTSKQLKEAQIYYNSVIYNAAVKQLGYDFGYLKPAPIETKANGGRVGMYMGGDPMDANPTPGFEPGSGPVQDPNQPPIMTAEAGQVDPNKLTFQELRARLPMEVSDQVVRLLAASEEALMVFAQIETQQDVSNFNQRFQADLKLPEQVV